MIARRLMLLGGAMLFAAPALAADPLAPLQGAPITVTGRLGVIPPDVLGTATLPIRADRYAVEWARASRDATASPALRQLIEPARNLGRLDQIAFVQAIVAQRIRWRSDATEWGRHDYWASAQETLAHGAGDQEDRAVLKMQALRALGFSPRDLYLTIGKETIGGPPIFVLLVRQSGRYFVLDDWSGPPRPVERRKDFVPMLSFAQGGTWIHGKRAGTRSSAAVAAAAGTTGTSR
ncbi:MAG TPA: transglutaminase-like cysteine peptidase [Sphingomicrobium sp.]|nr:transglutaminase-like cysteine peptidase [Sphingomicrobium sp.]